MSDRDYNAFKNLFHSLGLADYIKYGTFNKLCENVINENGNIRENIEVLIQIGKNNEQACSKLKRRRKILLIDEVDVFFSKDFYGQLYTPEGSIRDPTVKELIDFIWTEKNNSLTY